MGAAEETADFAALLRELKQRSGLSYEALAKRAHMSTSTLHRYCKGEGVPADYASLSRFARVCKATPQEVVELHRRWVMADAARERSRRAGADRAEGAPASAGRDRVAEPRSEPEGASGARAGSGAGAGADSELAVLPGSAAAVVPGTGDGAVPVSGAGVAPGSRVEVLPESGAADASEPGPADVPGPVSGTGDLTGTGAESSAEVGVPGRYAVPGRSFFRKRRVMVAASTLAVVALATAVLETIDAGASPGGRPRAATQATDSWEPREVASPPTSLSARPSRSPASKSPSANPSASSAATTGGGAAAAPDRAPDGAPDDDSVPLTVSARAHDWEDYCGTHYLVDRPPSQVPLPPSTLQDAAKWASDAGAVSSGRHRVSLTVQGTGDKAVVITSLHVRVVGSGAPLDWNAFVMGVGCGGGIEPREFELDFDSPRPTVRPKGGQRGFPYSVSQSDPEVLYITAHTSSRDVKWYLVLEWSSGGRQGTIEIKDGGKPFRTASMTGRPLYGYLPGSTEWEKQQP